MHILKKEERNCKRLCAPHLLRRSDRFPQIPQTIRMIGQIE
jgi:hypothetical protein